MKLGEIVERETRLGPRRFIATSILRSVSDRLNHVVLTPVPDGEDEQGLGRRYPGALVERIPWSHS